MFKQFGIAYRSIDLDSVEYQAGDRGGQIRRALNARFDTKTIPQIFVGGERVGGATEVFDAWREGRLQTLLRENGVAFDESIDTDPYALLPGWLHKR
jgi:cysteine synthase A